MNTAAGGYVFTLGMPIGDEGAARGFTKAGNGIVALTNAANTYSGDTTILAGGVSVDGDGTVGDGTGTIHLSGGSLIASASRTVATPNPIDVTADSAITTTSSATTVIMELSSNSIGGSAGTLTIRNDGADASTDLFNARFSGSGFDFARPVVIDNGATGMARMSSFNTTGTAQTFSGAISGNGTFFRSASTANTGGVTILTGDNTYTGGTALVDGGIGFGSDSVGAVTSGPIGVSALNVSPTGSNAYVFAYGGARTVNNNIVLNGNLGVTGSNDLMLGGAISSNTAGTGIAKSGSGTLYLSGAITYTGDTSVSDGKLVLQSNLTTSANVSVTGGALVVAHSGTHDRIVQTGAVSIAAGQIDLADNKLVTTSSIGGVQSLVQAGRNGGTWDGANAIITSETDAQGVAPLTTLAVATAGDVGFGGATTFGGQTVNSTDTLVMYTYAGDMNLNGQINGDDYFRIDMGYNSGGSLTGYENGDLNYDNKINADDYFIIDRNYGRQTLGVFPTAAPLAPAAGVSAVPEPASIVGLGLLAAASLAHRRRRA